ncbi:hypothetical protein [Granulicella sp. S190]|uniref:hypothetical protein n=1 Tax=Granulicella sp. S190 TaxID=1747226 RepID=UPI00131A8E86|nr:hypothetical protein [Granulicella sp. S190]
MTPSKQVNLPDDYHTTLSSIFEYNIPQEPPVDIDVRLSEVLRDAAVRSNQKPMDAGWSDWVKSVADNCKEAVHAELCSPDGGGLKKEYSDLADKGLTTGGITAISSVIVQVINPAFAVSSVLIYLAVWLTKFGLNAWCKLPAKQRATVNEHE